MIPLRAFAAIAGCLLGAAAMAEPVDRLGDWQAAFSEPTTRYGHNVLGDTPEWGRLCLSGPGVSACVTLPLEEVFEDLAPRLANMDDDPAPEVIVVQSNASLGAALVVYDLQGAGLRAIATPNIGTSFRWLAPVGIADLNGDGLMDVAYVDRPHLAKTLRVWTLDGGALRPLGSLRGVTNHRIGEAFITGGVRDCGDGAEMIVVDARWRNTVAVRFEDSGDLMAETLTMFSGPGSVDAALDCRS